MQINRKKMPAVNKIALEKPLGFFHKTVEPFKAMVLHPLRSPVNVSSRKINRSTNVKNIRDSKLPEMTIYK